MIAAAAHGDPAQHWAAIVGIGVGILAILGTLWKISRWFDKVNEKIGTPNGRGDVVTMLTAVVKTAEDAKSLAAEAVVAQEQHTRDVTTKIAAQDAVLARQDEALERLHRGQDETHGLIEGLTNAQAQTTAAIARLNQLHEKDDDDGSR